MVPGAINPARQDETRMRDSSLFPFEIASLAVAATGLPPGTYGWTRDSAFRALDALRATKVAVVSIEVYDKVQWGFVVSEESWECDLNPHELASEFALRSRAEARLWMQSLPREEVLFIIEFSTQDTAAEAYGVRSPRIDGVG